MDVLVQYTPAPIYNIAMLCCGQLNDRERQSRTGQLIALIERVAIAAIAGSVLNMLTSSIILKCLGLSLLSAPAGVLTAAYTVGVLGLAKLTAGVSACVLGSTLMGVGMCAVAAWKLNVHTKINLFKLVGLDFTGFLEPAVVSLARSGAEALYGPRAAPVAPQPLPGGAQPPKVTRFHVAVDSDEEDVAFHNDASSASVIGASRKGASAPKK